MSVQESSAEPFAKESVIVVAIDMRKGSSAIMNRALSYASHVEAEVHLVCVAEPNIANVKLPADMEAPELSGTDHALINEFVTRRRTNFQTTYGREAPKVIVHTETGDPADKLVQVAAELDADLIMLGTHGRTGIKRILLGSVAERVVRLAGCPVFVVRDKNHTADAG